MVLLYMVCHGSHQYTPFMLAYIPSIYPMDPMGKIPYTDTLWGYQQCGDRRIGMRYFFHPVTAKSPHKNRWHDPSLTGKSWPHPPIA